MRVALALGGGGARGIAHIGVLKFFEEVGFRPSIICGTSIGAIVGARYAQVPSWKVLWEDLHRSLESESFKRASSEFSERESNPFQEFMRLISKGIALSKAMATTSLVSERAFFTALGEFIPHDTLIEETRITFAAVAADLLSGREVILARGSIIKAVAASASIPGIFPPIRWGDMLLTDGGWVDVVPAFAARVLGADFVIGVWVSKSLELCERLGNAFDVVYRSDDIARYYLGWMRREECDALIEPEVGSYLWNQFEAKDELFEAGYVAAKRAWPRIKRAMAAFRLKRALGLRRRVVREFPYVIPDPD